MVPKAITKPKSNIAAIELLFLYSVKILLNIKSKKKLQTNGGVSVKNGVNTLHAITQQTAGKKVDFANRPCLLTIWLNKSDCIKTTKAAAKMFNVGLRKASRLKLRSNLEKNSMKPEFIASGRLIKTPTLNTNVSAKRKKILMKFKFLNCVIMLNGCRRAIISNICYI